MQNLTSNMGRENEPESELAWSSLSLALAMRGMEDEDTPRYSAEDLREVFESPCMPRKGGGKKDDSPVAPTEALSLRAKRSNPLSLGIATSLTLLAIDVFSHIGVFAGRGRAHSRVRPESAFRVPLAIQEFLGGPGEGVSAHSAILPRPFLGLSALFRRTGPSCASAKTGHRWSYISAP